MSAFGQVILGALAAVMVAVGFALGHFWARLSARRDDLEATIEELHRPKYDHLVKYLIVHPVAQPDRVRAFRSEHPAAPELIGRGDTWTAAARSLLYQVRHAAQLTHCPACRRRWSEHSPTQMDRCAVEVGRA